MKSKFSFKLYRVLVVVLAFIESILPFVGSTQPKMYAGIVNISNGIYAYSYPEEAVNKATADVLRDFFSRSNDTTSFSGENNAREGSAIIDSPFFEAYIGENEIPVYSTPTFSGEMQKTTLHSFSTVFVEDEDFSLHLKLKTFSFSVKKVVVLPSTLGVIPDFDRKSVTAEFTSFGTYTFMFNDNDQDHAFTLFIKRYVDEDKEISKYEELYGKENVTVFEPGVHEIDYLDIQKDNSVVYLKAGSVLLAKHKFEMTKPEDDWQIVEDRAPQNNTLGLQRYPVVNFYNCSNVKLLGNGTIDMTQLDWHERRGVVFSDCENVEIRDVFLINSPDWTLVVHCCDKATVENVNIFGYRTNSDGVAITNTTNAVVSNCFARSGDDLFEVKTLCTAEIRETKNVLFENCYAFNGKARCFGVTHEVYYPITDVKFKDCAVIYRDATWDNDVVCSLAVQVGEGGAPVKNIIFENIEIYKDFGRPINVLVMDDKITNSVIENVIFRNITWSADMKAQTEAIKGNKAEIKFENVSANSVCATAENIASWLENNHADCTVL